MELTINIDVLNENNLSVSEYIYLKALSENFDKPSMDKILGCIDRIEEDNLQEKGFIKITTEGNVLRDKGIKLFESGDLFTKYMVMFPVKAPNGRYLSPRGIETVAGQSIKSKWQRHFKGNPAKERRALEVLDAELKWRRETNQLNYMHNAETWLNQGDYEKFEYLLEDQQEIEEHQHKNFM
jgi:hypothetical protein